MKGLSIIYPNIVLLLADNDLLTMNNYFSPRSLIAELLCVNRKFRVCPFFALTSRYCRLAGNPSALTDSQRSSESRPTVSAPCGSSLVYIGSVCVCVCGHLLPPPLIITNRVSQALARRVRVTGQESNCRTMESFLHLTS